MGLAWPIVLGNVGQILIGVVDTMMVGRVGITELGACSFVSNLMMVPLVVAMGLLAAVPVLVSQAKGRGNRFDVQGHFSHSLALTLVVSSLVVLALLVNYRWLGHYGQVADVVVASKGYYLLIVASLVPAFIFQCVKGFSEGLGRANAPMVILVGSIGLNVVLNWLLIFGHWGFPEMGLLGAGWATLIARICSAVGLFLYVLAVRSYRDHVPQRWLAGLRWGGIGSVLKLGVPAAIQNLFEVGAFASSGIIIGWLGVIPLAAHQVAISWAALAFMIPLGISVAVGIRVGDAFGRGAVSEIRRIGFVTIGFVGVQTVVSALLFLVGGTFLASLFVKDAVVVEMAGRILVVVGLFQIVDGAQVICVGTLRGMSDVYVNLVVGFFAYWVIALPIGYLLAIPYGFGAVGMWSGLAIGLGIAAIFLCWRLAWLTRRGVE